MYFPFQQIILRLRMTSVQEVKRFSSDYFKFKEILEKSNNIAVLTGAGVSAESGIPVFRGSGGLWRTYRATDLASPTAFKQNPSLVWEFYSYRREVAFNANPNKAHLALAQYENILSKQNRKLTVITQNVDGLHIKAGSHNVIELHGALRKVKCTNCKYVYDNLDIPICDALKGRGNPESIQKDLPIIEKKDLPKCIKCKSLLRPYIIWFGENLDPNVLQSAIRTVEECDLCLLVGTSSIVYPAAMLAPSASSRGVPVAEFNLNENPSDDTFMFHFSGPCGTTLPQALGVEIS